MFEDLKPQTRQVLQGKKGHRFSVMRLASFHHSPRFASCSFDGTVRIWKENKQEKVLFYFSEAIEGLEITPDDKKVIVVLATSSKAFIYDLMTEENYQVGEGRDLAIRNLFGTNPSSTKTAFVTFDDDVYIFNHETRKLSPRLFVENVSGDSLIWIDDNVFSIPKRNGNVALINSEEYSLSIKQEITVHDGLITSICKDGNNIVTVSEDGTGKILDIDFQPQFGFKIEFLPLSVDYRDHLGVIVVTGDRNLLVVNTVTGDLVNYDQSLSGCNPLITSDSKIIKGTGEHDISIFSIAGEKIDQINGRSNTVEFATFLGDNQISFASGDKKVHLFNYSTGHDQVLATHQETISSVLFVPSKNFIIAGGYDDTISIWDLVNQQEIKRINSVPLVSTIAGSPSDDIFVAGCSGDNTIHVFTMDGDELANWAAHDDFISSVFFMNDEVIISGADDGFVKFWNRNGKLISSIKTGSPIKSIETTLEYDYNITGHANGDIFFWEKISNRKVTSYNVGAPVQRIKVIDNNSLLFAAQNRLFLMKMDGFHIVDVQEVCQHSEPIRGIHWQAKPEKIITIDHSIEINETTFTSVSELSGIPIDDSLVEESPTTIMFAPGTEPEFIPSSVSKTSAQEVPYSSAEIEELTKISEYLDTISQQLNDLVIPKLKSIGVDARPLDRTLNELQKEVRKHITGDVEVKSALDKPKEKPPSRETKEDWKSIDWGRRRH